MIRQIFILFLFIFVIIVSQSVLGDNVSKSSSESIKYLAAPAKTPAFLIGEPPKIEFEFNASNEMMGWLRENGEWFIEGKVMHNRLLCGTYQLGMRFGKGNPGCVDVEWLTEPEYATEQKQCNQSIRHHKGYGSSTELTMEYNEITCAEALIRCTGVCN